MASSYVGYSYAAWFEENYVWEREETIKHVR